MHSNVIHLWLRVDVGVFVGGAMSDSSRPFSEGERAVRNAGGTRGTEAAQGVGHHWQSHQVLARLL